MANLAGTSSLFCRFRPTSRFSPAADGAAEKIVQLRKGLANDGNRAARAFRAWNFRKETGIIRRGFSAIRGHRVSADELDETARAELGRRIEGARRKIGFTLVQLAARAGYDERTIRNVIKGRPTRPATVRDICKVLGVAIDSPETKAVEIADREHGGYTRNHFENYTGMFYAYRRSFSFPRNIIRSLYEFSWNGERGCLVFRETQHYDSPNLKQTIDFSQEGEVFISNMTGLIHLLTKAEGALRLVTLTKLRAADRVIRGVVLTQAQGEFYYQPSVSPIFFQAADKQASLDELAQRAGPIQPGDPDYARIDAALTDIERRVGIFALTPPAPG
jgi:transcriptional regulator with XRE-family HTH domain